MRSDLTAAFEAAMQASARKPRTLAVFHFDAGDAYVSDQALGAADGLEHEYEALVEDWGDLMDSGDPMSPDTGEVRQMTISLWNGGATPFSDHFLAQDPEDVLVDVYQWFLGLDAADMALVDTFVCQDPIQVTEAGRVLSIDLVSLPMRYDGHVGELITANEWPDARPQDLGRRLPVVVGGPVEVPGFCVRTAASATLSASILEGSLSATVYEDLDAEGFPTVGTIQVGDERMTYSSRTGDTFAISQRGADGTAAAEHLDGDAVTEHVTDFTWAFCVGPVSDVGTVRVAGIPAPAGIYAVHEDHPARVVFTERPYAIQYAKGSRFLEILFDAVNEAVNTALQPHYAYDSAAVTSAAQIDEDHTILAIQQVTVNPDRGQIVKAYLAVEHWEQSSALLHDRVRVDVVGLGTVGYLTRPSEYDEIEIEAEVDIDHGHTHSISGEHVHSFTDPAYGTTESPHNHASSGLSETERKYATSQASFKMDGVAIGSATVSGLASFDSAVLHYKTSPNYGCLFSVNYGPWVYGGSGDSYIAINPSSATVSIRFKYGGSPLNGTMVAYEIWIDYTVGATIEPAYTGVGVTKMAGGSQGSKTDKSADDVQALTTDNVAVDLLSSNMPSRTVVDLFDVTDTVAFSWAWFTNREVRLTYEGTVDNQTVYVLHVFFDVEYRKKETVFSDEITADVTGLVDDAEGSVTGTPGAAIARPDLVRRYLLQERAGLPAANVDEDSFDAAGVRYDALGYGFDGVIDGDLTVRDAEKALARQSRSRFFWDAGRAVCAVRERHADWTIDKTLTQAESPIRLKGMQYRRRNASEIVNRVNLHYDRDHTSMDAGVAGYRGEVSVQNNESITAHGLREQDERFMFDLVADQTMAEDLAAFYLEDGKPSQSYTIEGWLPWFDLQKEDHLRITHDFMSLSKAAMRIASVERVFGSGKLRRPNLVRLICEAWYRLMRVAKGDRVTVGDLLNVEVEMGLEFDTTIRAMDGVLWGLNLSESVSVAEALLLVVTWIMTAPETVTAADALAADLGVELSDSVTARTWLDAEIGSGFGLGGFGEPGRFGSLSEFDINPDLWLEVVDELVSTLTAALSDSVTVADMFDAVGPGQGFGFDAFGDSGFGSLTVLDAILAAAVAVADVLTAAMSVVDTESVSVSDNLESVHGKGFGVGMFGDAPFGGADLLLDTLVTALETMAAALGAAASDSVAVSDDFSISSGFGSPWSEGDGFGDGPFGR